MSRTEKKKNRVLNHAQKYASVGWRSTISEWGKSALLCTIVLAVLLLMTGCDTSGSVSSPMVHEGTVYAGSKDGHLNAIDAETGEEAWRFQTDDRTSSYELIEGTSFDDQPREEAFSERDCK